MEANADTGATLNLCFRSASAGDAALLAVMNQQLIRDEQHRNSMKLAELEQRMREWLESDYEAVICEAGAETAGYALFRAEPEWIYLRQFFVREQHRRKGVGRRMFRHLESQWKARAKRIRLEVLVGNDRAIAFWHAVGLRDYCLTLEADLD